MIFILILGRSKQINQLNVEVCFYASVDEKKTTTVETCSLRREVQTGLQCGQDPKSHLAKK